MIFYFTGTGNSLYVAKKLAEKLGEGEVHSMAAYKPEGQVGGADEKIGFVFPSYYGNLPRIVKKFVGSLDIRPGTYIFTVVTAGGAGGGSVAMTEKALAEKSLTLNYGRGILMPANYIAKYNPMFLGRSAKADKKIQRIADEISSKKTLVKKNSITSNNLYSNIEELDRDFFAENHCTGCGFCEKNCPVKNIRLAGKRPEWLHRCEHCMACIHRCPEQAIQYGAKTKKRRRYYNPHV